jgi:hypothetical protein
MAFLGSGLPNFYLMVVDLPGNIGSVPLIHGVIGQARLCCHWHNRKYVYEYTRCDDNVLVLLQYIYMFRVPAVPIIRSTVLQLAVNGITHITLGREMYGNVHLKGPYISRTDVVYIIHYYALFLSLCSLLLLLFICYPN